MPNINIDVEKNRILSARQRYDIIADAVESAYDDGFMNEFIFIRALYLGAAAALFEDFKYDEDTYMDARLAIKSDPLGLWDERVQDDTMNHLVVEFVDELNELGNEAEAWYSDYEEYAYSLRGLLDNISGIMDGVTQRADEELNRIRESGDLQNVIDIADDWGAHRGEKLDGDWRPSDDISNGLGTIKANSESLFETA